jgi:hypothetical protein
MFRRIQLCWTRRMLRYKSMLCWIETETATEIGGTAEVVEVSALSPMVSGAEANHGTQLESRLVRLWLRTWHNGLHAIDYLIFAP